MVTANAPGKVYLFGEHAVVYGEPAVPCAIELRARVTAEGLPGDDLRWLDHQHSFTVGVRTNVRG